MAENRRWGDENSLAFPMVRSKGADGKFDRQIYQKWKVVRFVPSVFVPKVSILMRIVELGNKVQSRGNKDFL